MRFVNALSSKVGVCILGMHRSGTSCLAGSLRQAGLHLGHVVERSPHNLKGNLENLEVRMLNDAVLSTSGGSWDIPPTDIHWTDEQARTRDAMISTLASSPSDRWGFKDPRTTLTMPFWQERVPVLRVVGTFRHPVSVANSLAARDRMSFEAGIRLWRGYNLRLLSYVTALDVLLLSFDASRDEYLAALGAAIRHCGLTSPREFDNQQEPFFDDGLRQNSVPDTTSTSALPVDIIQLYEQLNWCAQTSCSRYASAI